MVLLAVWWIIFWRFRYARIITEAGVQSTGKCCYENSTTSSNHSDPPALKKCAAAADEHALIQIWARVTGHLATLLLSFTLFPTTRNSLWESVFGIPFERAIKYHRIVGVLAYLVRVSADSCQCSLDWRVYHFQCRVPLSSPPTIASSLPQRCLSHAAFLRNYHAH